MSTGTSIWIQNSMTWVKYKTLFPSLILDYINVAVSNLSSGENSLAMELVSQNAHGKLLSLRQDSIIGDIIHGSQNLEVVAFSHFLFV